MLYVFEGVINGVLMGSIYGLTAMGLTIIFGVLKVINFAHGSMLMVGMYVAYWAIVLTGVNPYLALVIVIPVMFFFGYYLQNIVIKPIFIAEKNVREPITVRHMPESVALIAPAIFIPNTSSNLVIGVTR